jgi:hypothetical protein
MLQEKLSDCFVNFVRHMQLDTWIGGELTIASKREIIRLFKRDLKPKVWICQCIIDDKTRLTICEFYGLYVWIRIENNETFSWVRVEKQTVNLLKIETDLILVLWDRLMTQLEPCWEYLFEAKRQCFGL